VVAAAVARFARKIVPRLLSCRLQVPRLDPRGAAGYRPSRWAASERRDQEAVSTCDVFLSCGSRVGAARASRERCAGG
jgi:hypothetical protein